MKRSPGGLLEIHTAVFLFGLAGLFAKWVSLPSPLIVLGRVLFAALALGVFLLGSGRRIKPDSHRHLLVLVLLGPLLAAHWITFFQSIKVSTVAVGVLSYSTFPVFVSFLEPAFFDERPRLQDILIALVAFLGVALMTPELRIENAVTRGVLWGVLSAFTFAILSVLNRRYVQQYSGPLIAFYQDAAATVVLLPLLAMHGLKIGGGDILLLVLLGVVFTAVAHSLFIKGMERIKAQSASIIATLEPVYGIVFAALLLNEIPGPRVLMAGAVILAAACVATLRSRCPHGTIIPEK